MKSLFAPAIAVMNRLSYLWKFAVIGLLFAVPLSVTAKSLVNELTASIRFSEKEVQGNEYLRPLRQLAEHLQMRRDLSYNRGRLTEVENRSPKMNASLVDDVQAIDGVDRRHGEDLRTTLPWTAIKGRLRKLDDDLPHLSAHETFVHHTELIDEVLDLMDQVGDQSNLILDPDLDSFYQMETLVNRLPELAEYTGQARALATRLAGESEIADYDVFQLSNLSDRIKVSLRVICRHYDVTFRETRNPGIEPKLEPALKEAVAESSELLELLSQIAGKEQRGALRADELWKSGSRALAADYRLYDLSSPVLDELLQARVAGSSRKLNLVAWCTLSSLLVVTYLFIGFYLSVMNTVRSLDAAARRMVDGRMNDGGILLDRHDELAQVTQAFSALATRLRRELSESKQERDRAAIAEERTRLIIDTALDAVVTMDERGLITTWNKQAETIFGWSRDEVVGRSLAETIVPPQQRQAHEAGLKRFLTTGEGPILNMRIELSALRRDRQEFPAELTVSYCRMKGAIIFNAFVRDITERKRAEQERKILEEQLRHAQKLESVGQLAAGVAHEINTPIQFIGDNTRFLHDAFGDLQRVVRAGDRLLAAAREGGVTPALITDMEAVVREADTEYLKTEIPSAIQQSADGLERVSRIVQAMKEFSHPGGDDKTAIDINKAIDNTLIVARNEWKYVAEAVTDLAPSLPLVACLPGEINQVLLNLIVNAAHAIGEVVSGQSGQKGTITIATRAADNGVEIRVTDTGCGIPAANRDRIFDPFFTTKPVGKGTGQGLTITHAVVVKKHGGTIRFESEIGKGTTFVIWLPLAQSTERAA